MRVKDAVGNFGEDVAVRHLAALGLTILERNWRCPAGELDIVATEGSTLVFAEVKTRSSPAFGDPAEAVTPAKAARIRRLAVQWLAEHPEQRHPDVRFDVVSVVRVRSGGLTISHFPGAF